MRRLALNKKWLTETEFVDTVVLSRLSPGITIIAQALLIGKHAAGVRGMIAAITGMMLPAVVITVGLARVYQAVSSSPAAATPLLCIAGVAAGFAAALAIQLCRGQLKRSHRLLGPLAILCYAGLSLATGNPIVLLVVAIAVGIAFPRLFPTRGQDS
jgi:chromate transporter